MTTPESIPPTARTRAQQADETKSRVLAAAVDLIEAHGEAGMRVTDVATRAKVSVGTIYTHFADRDDLVSAARLEQFLGAVHLDVDSIAGAVNGATSSADLVHRLREVSRIASDPARADNRWRRAEILGTARSRPQLAERIGVSQHETNQALAEIARAGQVRGVIDAAVDPMALGIMVQAFTFGLVLADIDPDSTLDPTAWLDVVTRFTTAITPAGAGAEEAATGKIAQNP